MYLSAIRHLHCVLTTFLRPFVAFVGSINDQSVDRHWNIIIYDNACFEVKQKKWIYRTKRLNVDRTPYYLRISYQNLRFGEVILPFTKLSSFTKKYCKVTQLLERSKKKKYSKIISLLQVDARYFTHRTIATHRWKGNIRRYRWTSMWEKYAWIECAVATTADHTKAQFIDGIVQVAWNADIIVESSSRVLWLMFDVGLSQLVALTSKLRSISQFPECYKYSALAIWYRILWPDKQKYRVPMHFGMRRALCYAHVCGLRHSIHSVCGHT